MSMQYDVKGATCAANSSTTAFDGRTRLKGDSMASRLAVAMAMLAHTMEAKAKNRSR